MRPVICDEILVTLENNFVSTTYFFFYLKREIVVICRWSGCTHPTACYTETEFNLARSDDGSF